MQKKELVFWKTGQWNHTIRTAKRKKETKTKDGLGDFWDNVKHTNIHTIGIPEGEERENRTEKLFEEIIAENFPNPAKDIDIQVQDRRESQTR